jgi:diguanylate cyclase
MSDDWKQKYLASLDRHDKAEKDWQTLESLLRQGLTRVALAAEGVDPQLDDQLKRLRKLVRGGAGTDKLEGVVTELSAIVTRLDDARQEKSSVASPQALLSHWLDSLEFPRHQRKQIKALHQAFDEATHLTELEGPLRDLAGLVNDNLNQPTSAGGGGGLLQRFFGGDKEAPSATPGTDTASQEPPINHFCIQLLDTLSLPAELSDEVEALKDRLSQEDFTQHSIAPTFSAIADLISTMRQEMEKENKALQDFLLQLTERLKDVDQSIEGAQDHHRAAKDSGRRFDAAVQAEVNQIASTVEETQEQAQLKVLIQSRLDAIQQHLNDYRHSEEERQQQLETQLAYLNQRLQAMELEGQRLRQRLREKHEQAVRDPLTGLYNRLAYDERMGQELSRSQRYQTPLSLAVFDVDRFKEINDDYGHKAGDKALKLIAEQLLAKLRHCDFLARYGGEEFVVLMPETALEDALGVAEKLRHAVEGCQFHYQSKRVPITISAGVAQLRQDDSMGSLFQRADQAMYQAKEAGRNRTHAESRE